MIFPLKPPFIIWLRQINRGYHIFSAKKFWNDPSLRLSYFRLDPAPSVQRTSEEFYRNATTGKSTLKIIIKHRQTKTQLPFIETIYIYNISTYIQYIYIICVYIYTRIWIDANEDVLSPLFDCHCGGLPAVDKNIRTEERRCHGALSPHKGWMSRKKWPATMYQYCITL